MRRTTAPKLPRAICTVAVQIAEMESGQCGATGVNVLTLAEVALVGGHERSKQRRTSVVNQQSGFRRNMSSAMKQFLVPKIQTANLTIGARGVIALALVMV